MHKAFFLDWDGTINVDYDFLHRPEEWTWWWLTRHNIRTFDTPRQVTDSF